MCSSKLIHPKVVNPCCCVFNPCVSRSTSIIVIIVACRQFVNVTSKCPIVVCLISCAFLMGVPLYRHSDCFTFFLSCAWLLCGLLSRRSQRLLGGLLLSLVITRFLPGDTCPTAFLGTWGSQVPSQSRSLPQAISACCPHAIMASCSAQGLCVPRTMHALHVHVCVIIIPKQQHSSYFSHVIKGLISHAFSSHPTVNIILSYSPAHQ